MIIPNCSNCKYYEVKDKDKWNRCKRLYKRVHCGNVCPEHEFKNNLSEDKHNVNIQENGVDVPSVCGETKSQKQG